MVGFLTRSVKKCTGKEIINVSEILIYNRKVSERKIQTLLLFKIVYLYAYKNEVLILI